MYPLIEFCEVPTKGDENCGSTVLYSLYQLQPVVVIISTKPRCQVEHNVIETVIFKSFYVFKLKEQLFTKFFILLDSVVQCCDMIGMITYKLGGAIFNANTGISSKYLKK